MQEAGTSKRTRSKSRKVSLVRTRRPRLRIRTPKNEVVLDPIARFGGGKQGVVDLVLMPTFETVYLITFKNGKWQIMAPYGTLYKRPFTQATLVNTITHLSPQ